MKFRALLTSALDGNSGKLQGPWSWSRLDAEKKHPLVPEIRVCYFFTLKLYSLLRTDRDKYLFIIIISN